MYISTVVVRPRCSVIAKRSEDGLVTLLQTANCSTLFRVEGILWENLPSPSCRRPQSPQKDCLDYCFQVQGTWNSISLPGSGGRFKLTPEVLAIIEEQMHADDETTASQLVKMLTDAGHDVSKSTTI